MRSSSTAITSRAVAICSGAMRKLVVSPVPTTKVPTPWRVSTSPPACSLDSASRTTVRLTPNSFMMAASVGSLSPARMWPSRMRAVIVSTRPSARLRGRRCGWEWLPEACMSSRVFPCGSLLTGECGLSTITAVVRQQMTYIDSTAM
jgi:hypothetical protein